MIRAAFALLLFALPGSATWSLVQAAGKYDCSGTTCTVPMEQTVGAGHLLVATTSWKILTHITNVTGGTYVHCAGCAGGNAGPTSFVDMGYILSSTGGQSSITITTDSSCSNGCTGIIWELSFTHGPITLDTYGLKVITSNCSTCAGVTLSPTGSNDAILSMTSCSGTCNGVSVPYVADSPSGTLWPNGNAPIHWFNTTSGTAPSLTQTPSDSFATAAMAFTESPTTTGTVLGGLFGFSGLATVH